VDPADVVAVGICNQRQTVVAWHKETGQALHPSLLWTDVRASECEKAVLALLPLVEEARFSLRHKCGLPISSVFPALKWRWLLDNVDGVSDALRTRQLLLGTTDTWLAWRLTDCQAHATDVTNASATMLMDLDTLQWDQRLCQFFGVPIECLPEIKSSSEIVARLNPNLTPFDVPLSAMVSQIEAIMELIQYFL